MAELVNNLTNNNANPIEWLNNTHPSLHFFAMDFVIKKKFPDYVQKHIQDYWIKISDANGGTYKKPVTEQELLKKGMEIVGTKSTKKVIKYLMTNPKTGHEMSYAESRMMYG